MTNRDGEVNYTTFSDEELREANDGIDPIGYPVNFKNLSDEMAARGISANHSSGDSPPGSAMRGLVAFAVLSAMLCVLYYGIDRFPDGPIKPCRADQYCGKQGQLHTRDEFRAFHRWEMTMFFLWPTGMLAVGVLALRRSRTDKRPA